MSGELVWQEPHAKSVWRVAFTPDGSTLLFSFEDDSIHLTSVPGFFPVGTIDHWRGSDVLFRLAVSPDGRLLAVAADAQTRIQADLACIPMFPVAKRSPIRSPRRGFVDPAPGRRAVGTRIPRRLPQR